MKGGDGMRTDAMESFLNGSGAQVNRMDYTGRQQRCSAGMGSLTGDNATKSRNKFQKALADVTAGNVEAHRVTKKSIVKKETCVTKNTGLETPKESPPKDETEKADARTADRLALLAGKMVDDEPAGPVEADDEVVIVSDDVAADAEKIIREALAEISEALGISIFGNLEDLSLKEVGTDTKEQFAEIVFILKKMMQAFELGRESGTSVELPAQTVEGADIDALADVLRINTFKIEVATNVLGIAESVQKQVSIKMEMFQATGIIQATDPSTLSMASQHTERLFKGLFTAGEATPELKALVAQVKKMLAENGGEQPVAVGDKTGSSVPAKGELQQFDAKVYRALLKIDLKDRIGIQNGDAASGGEKIGDAKAGKPLVPVALNPGDLKVADGSEAVPSLDLQSGAQLKQVAGMEARISQTLARMTDETVMEQVTGKLQSVVRSGMSDVRIQLRPESLGEVSLRIRMEGDVVLAKIEVQNQQVKEIMERNLPMLKDALASHNIGTGSFDIQVGNGSGRQFGNMPHSPWNDEETAQGGLYQKGEEDEHGSSGKKGEHRESETGRRFGSNSVEYFA
jgi:flagellar hook-length control protein FliK